MFDHLRSLTLQQHDLQEVPLDFRMPQLDTLSLDLVFAPLQVFEVLLRPQCTPGLRKLCLSEIRHSDGWPAAQAARFTPDVRRLSVVQIHRWIFLRQFIEPSSFARASNFVVCFDAKDMGWQIRDLETFDSPYFLQIQSFTCRLRPGHQPSPEPLTLFDKASYLSTRVHANHVKALFLPDEFNDPAYLPALRPLLVACRDSGTPVVLYTASDEMEGDFSPAVLRHTESWSTIGYSASLDHAERLIRACEKSTMEAASAHERQPGQPSGRFLSSAPSSPVASSTQPPVDSAYDFDSDSDDIPLQPVRHNEEDEREDEDAQRESEEEASDFYGETTGYAYAEDSEVGPEVADAYSDEGDEQHEYADGASEPSLRDETGSQGSFAEYDSEAEQGIVYHVYENYEDYEEDGAAEEEGDAHGSCADELGSHAEVYGSAGSEGELEVGDADADADQHKGAYSSDGDAVQEEGDGEGAEQSEVADEYADDGARSDAGGDAGEDHDEMGNDGADEGEVEAAGDSDEGYEEDADEIGYDDSYDDSYDDYDYDDYDYDDYDYDSGGYEGYSD